MNVEAEPKGALPGVIGFPAGDNVFGMPFYLHSDLALLAVVSFVAWVVADDVTQVQIGKDAVVDSGCLRLRFQKLGPATRHFCEVDE